MNTVNVFIFSWLRLFFVKLETINQEWPGNSLQYYKSYKNSIGNKVFFVVLGIGKTGARYSRMG
jgi:hypothetical protein